MEPIPPSKPLSKKRIVILGAGFAGIYAARRLERELHKDEFQIILVAKDNYFVFQPMLPEVISGTIGLLDVVTPIRTLLTHTELHIREVESIDLERKCLTTSTGFDSHPHVIQYDHLVLALGTVTDFRGMRGLPEHALPFKNLADALHVRNHVIRALDEASIQPLGSEARKRLLTFVVAGGGFSGVEVAAELNDFVRHVGKQYPSIASNELRVVLIHGQDRILPEMAKNLALFAQNILQRRGVEILLNTRLKAASRDCVLLDSGPTLATHTLISTVPASTHPIVDALPVPKAKNGRILVDEYHRVQGTADVWAIGDCATTPIAGGGFAPPTAQHAVREGTLAAENIIATFHHKALKPFRFRGLGKMGSLGRRSAVAEVFGLKFSGFIAWWIWRTVYLFKMPSWLRRIRVALSWTLDLFMPPELVQLRLSSSSSITQEHFEPGDTVFEQGDVGNRLYIVLSGKAEVIRKNLDGTEQVLAHLAAGEYFGEAALLRSGPRNATVRCIEAMNVLSLPKKDFGLLAAHIPSLQHELEAVLNSRSGNALKNQSHKPFVASTQSTTSQTTV